MAEGSDDKTEPASAKRRQEAFDAGQFARSQDLTAAVLLLAGILVIHTMGQSFVGHLSSVMRDLLSTLFRGDPHDALGDAMRVAGPHALRVVVPVLLIMAGVAVAVTGLQVGFRLTLKPLEPNLAKLNPVAGFGRMFAGANMFQLGMNLVKLVTVGVVIYTRVRQELPQIVGLFAYEFPENMAVAFGIVYGLALRVAAALMVLALADWMYHKWKFERDIRMSKQELKDEARSSEGDLEVKARRRSMARKMIMQRIQADVPQADVVVTNPTELAIALKYDPENMAAPRVVAKGAGFLAMRIRQVALQHGVPIVEKKPLAQALYKTVEAGQEVPPQFYQAIAEILAYVYELAGRGMRRVKQSA